MTGTVLLEATGLSVDYGDAPVCAPVTLSVDRSSPMVAVPVGVSATLVRGPDIGLLGTAPVAPALLLGTAPAWLVGVLWSHALAAFAVGMAGLRD